MTQSQLEEKLTAYVEQNAHRLIEILQELIRRPSENTAPTGSEAACQHYIADFLRNLGCDTTLYSMDEVPGLKDHPLYLAGRDYTNRPNTGARIKGSGSAPGSRPARSLLLSGHIDTVPVGSAPWQHDPFGGAVEGNRLYGRGANDMKGGVATNLFVIECLRKLNITLAGDLLFESVIDEEFGGVNGTLAGRLMGFNADAVILSEPSFLRICPAQRGGRIAHITLHSSGGGILDNEAPTPGAPQPAVPQAPVIDQLTFFLTQLKAFAEQRRKNARPHPLYDANQDPVPVAVTKIFTAPWGTTEPISLPATCRIELYWQAMPGESLAAIDREFHSWIASLQHLPGSPWAGPLDVTFPGRWLPGSAIEKDDPLVKELAACAERILGQPPVIAGIEGPCDMFVFHQLTNTPAVLWGAKGANTHAPDEYIEIDTLINAAKVLLAFVCQWCG